MLFISLLVWEKDAELYKVSGKTEKLLMFGRPKWRVGLDGAADGGDSGFLLRLRQIAGEFFFLPRVPPLLRDARSQLDLIRIIRDRRAT